MASEIGGVVEKAWGAMTLSGDENSLRYRHVSIIFHKFWIVLCIFLGGAVVAASAAHPGLGIQGWIISVGGCSGCLVPISALWQ